jgi:hypothetical protein
VQAKFLPEQSPYEINLPEPGTPPPELDEEEEEEKKRRRLRLALAPVL